MSLVGRKEEIETLNRLYYSDKAQFVAVYGRRRVGKTFLIDETFKNRITFHHAGLSPADHGQTHRLKDQLNYFYLSLQYQGLGKAKKPSSWMEAFYLLQLFLDERDDGTRQLVFLDELPWLDTPKSGFMTAFEGFWNNWGCHRSNLMLVVCGSANSWILDNLINNHGGLYNRVTYQMKLMPFTLRECEEYFDDQNLILSRYDMVQSYMILGGIPFYLNYFQQGLSLSQNIDRMFFSENAPLREEYDRLFATVFARPDQIKTIVELLFQKNAGLTRKEISEKLKLLDGALLNSLLSALTASGFVVKYVPFGYSKKQVHYKLTDPFCLFYLRFLRGNDVFQTAFWEENTNSQSIAVWRGLAFESVCFQHIRQIKRALGIEGVSSTQAAWSKKSGDEDGTQIDLLIDRSDHVVNMCEIKYYSDVFTVDKSYDQILRHRIRILSENYSKKTTIHSTLITTFGLTHNIYSDVFQKVITLDVLFDA